MGNIYNGGEEALSAYFDRISIQDVKERIGHGEAITLSLYGLPAKEKS